MKRTAAIRGLAAALAFAIGAGTALADGPYVLVAGRRDPRVVIIDLAEALKPANNGTANAVLSRVRVTPDVIVEGQPVPASGLPSNVVVAPDGRTAFAVNHAGNATPAATNAFQHGHLGTVAVIDLRRALDPANNNTTNAIRALIPTGFWGPVGLGLADGGKLALVANSEGEGKEDGAREISVIDLRRNAHVQTVFLALGDGGKVPQAPGRSCPELAANPALRPMAIPHPDFGCFPATNGVGIVHRHGGFAFAANGGTDDVSVIDIDRARRGEPKAEVARIPVESGAWGLAVDPGGKLVAVTNRESAETGVEGNTISLIDVHDAIRGRSGAEAARVRVGTDDAAVPTRPFSLSFTPDGRHIVVANFRTNDVSIVDVRRALAGGLGGGPGAEVARIPLVKPGGGPARPRGVAVTPDGRYAVVSGGAQFTTNLPLGAYGLFCEQVTAAANCGALWVIDLRSQTVVATVTGVGNEPYMVDITHGPSRRH
jgi:DNA-binding beta-propeller fold protein YncE